MATLQSSPPATSSWLPFPRLGAASRPSRKQERWPTAPAQLAVVASAGWAAAQHRRVKSLRRAEGSREGFKVNDKYKGALSYGRCDDDDFEEAAKIREKFSGDINATQAARVKRLAEAQRRMKLRQLRGKKTRTLDGSWAEGMRDIGKNLNNMAAYSRRKSSEGARGEDKDDDEGEAGQAEGTLKMKGGRKKKEEDEDGDGPEDGDASDGDAYGDLFDGTRRSSGGTTSEGGSSSSRASQGKGSASASSGRQEGSSTVKSSPGNLASSRFANLGDTDDGGFQGLSDAIMFRVESGSDGMPVMKSTTVGAATVSAAEQLAGDQRRMKLSSAEVLWNSAAVLSKAGQHQQAAVLLLELRDFGVDREVLNRGLSVSQAGDLFEEAAMMLGMEYRRAGSLSQAWSALVAICAEPNLQSARRRPSVEVLSTISLQMSHQIQKDPSRQVELLQGAVDAEAVFRVLPRDKRDELELNLALALQDAGQLDESKELLQILARSAGSSRRRQQADWALLVQQADISNEPCESAREMRSIWDANMVPITSSASSGAAGAVAAATRRQQRKSQGAELGAGMGGMGDLPTIMAVAVVVLPLFVPLAAVLKDAK